MSLGLKDWKYYLFGVQVFDVMQINYEETYLKKIKS